jgi:hypothetical protein
MIEVMADFSLEAMQARRQLNDSQSIKETKAKINK